MARDWSWLVWLFLATGLVGEDLNDTHDIIIFGFAVMVT
jgi:hypothetical protein